MRELIPTEEQEQEALCEWLRLHNITFHHSPNEGMHAVQYRVKQKALGVSKGFPDVMIFDKPAGEWFVDGIGSMPFSGVAIELKRRKGGVTSPEQQQWLSALESRGWVVNVCKGADEAISFLEGLGFGKRGAA
jgi:hypothetical protein